ncbi:MAG: phosphatidylglycerophosphatase A [Phycisphaerales bacterium]|nr:phosphatidylglycerophosphatase A [Phycisphaerales bacterium]
MRRFKLGMVTVGGIGLAPVASGTFGSIPPVVMALLLVQSDQPTWLVNGCLILLGLVFSIACIRFGGLAEEVYGKKDPGQVVADEIGGQCVALLFLPWAAPDVEGALLWNLMLGVGAFLAFRFFDILKPPPARGLEKIRGGLGILVDDLITGAMALVLGQLVSRVVHGFWW